MSKERPFLIDVEEFFQLYHKPVYLGEILLKIIKKEKDLYVSLCSYAWDISKDDHGKEYELEQIDNPYHEYYHVCVKQVCMCNVVSSLFCYVI